ncbi:MAG: IS110 family transposase [Thermodesulfobacteriota bacterium]|nr:IS110 family transposase [Candidatus Thermoplasmatota archaeon]MEA3487308.1 IS110 family transposase [Thermodesulfobacteriota bacterium]
MKKLYGGLDIHKEKNVGCILNESGDVVREQCFPVSKKAVEKFVEGISNAEISFAIEACGMWRAAYHMLTDLGFTVKLANPKKTHDIACNKKTDRVDAHILADLLRTNYLPEVWIPDEQTLKFRDITRHKTTLTRLRVKIQAKIKSTLLRNGIPYKKNVWNENTLSKLAEINPNLKNLIVIYNSLKNEEKEVKKRIGNISRNKEETTLLMSVNGIGELSSLIILAEIGDIHRFESPKSLVSYAGLCPGVYQSANTERTVKNNAVNKWLKWILYECSGRAIALDLRFKKYFHQMVKKKNYQIARRATARKMLTIIWYMLTNKEPYRVS